MRREFCDHCGRELPTKLCFLRIERILRVDSGIWDSKEYVLCSRCDRTIKRWLSGKLVPEIDSFEEVENNEKPPEAERTSEGWNQEGTGDRLS